MNGIPSSLFHAYYSRDLDTFKSILGEGVFPASSKRLTRRHQTVSPLSVKDEINLRDALGRTIAHVVASDADADFALPFMIALLGHVALDLNAVDDESGWTALHRALYHGNIRTAQAIIASRGQEAIKVKDKESNSPLDVLQATLPHPMWDYVFRYHTFYSYGSNKNNNLGFADGNDRPSHPEEVSMPLSDISVKISVLKVRMARFHTVLITQEPKNNLFVCGFGNDGRLGIPGVGMPGTGAAQFTPARVPYFENIHIVDVAPGQDHTIALDNQGTVYTWGSNKFGQLGIADVKRKLCRIPVKVGIATSTEFFGVAASALHSVAYSQSTVFTWGGNNGQLGYSTISNRRTFQDTPREVAISGSYFIKQVVANDRATACLTTDGRVLLLANSGYFYIDFGLDRDFSIPSRAVFRPRRLYKTDRIINIRAGDNVMAAASSMGDVYTFALDDEAASLDCDQLQPKIVPKRIWSMRKIHMMACDVDVGQDGSVVICTASGSVWIRVRRNKVKFDRINQTQKDFKFIRLPNMTHVSAVCSNSKGAYGALRSEPPIRLPDLPRSCLGDDLFSLLPWSDAYVKVMLGLGDEAVSSIFSGTLDSVLEFLDSYIPDDAPCDLQFVLDDGLIISAHEKILAARCKSWTDFKKSHNVTAKDGRTIVDLSQLQITSVVLVCFLFFIYTNDLPNMSTARNRILRGPDIKNITSSLLDLAELMSVPSLKQGLSWLYFTDQRSRLSDDLRSLMSDTSSSDVTLLLADGAVKCHSLILTCRCPFFKTLYGSTSSRSAWLTGRTGNNEDNISVNFKHFTMEPFSVVVSDMYLDDGLEKLTVAEIMGPVDWYIDYCFQVMAICDELMIDRLKSLCEHVLCKRISLSTVSRLLRDSMKFSAEDLKSTCLEFVCANLELVLESRLLDSFDSEMIRDVEIRVKINQAQHQPLAKSDLLYNELCVRHPDLVSSIILAREQALENFSQDSMINSNYGSQDSPKMSTYTERNLSSSSLPRGSFKTSSRISSPKTRSPLILPRQSPVLQPSSSPLLRPLPDLKGTGDLIFEMDDEFETVRPSPKNEWKFLSSQTSSLNPTLSEYADDGWMDCHGKPLKSNSPSFRPQPTTSSMSTPSKLSNKSDRSQVSTPSKMLCDSLPRLPGSAASDRKAFTAPSRSSSYSIPIEPLLKASHERRRKFEQHGSVSPSSSIPVTKQVPWNVTSNRKSSFQSPTTSNITLNKPHDGAYSSSLTQPRPSSRLSRDSPNADNKAPVSSLASIMAQQQDEVFHHQEQLDQAKGKSFREIQEQEAFEKWWEAESQRVQNAEAMANQSKHRSRKNRSKKYAIAL